MRVLRSGWQGPHRCCWGRRRRYPEDFAAGPVRSWQEAQRRRQRTNRSAMFPSMHKTTWMPISLRTYENEDPISILLPTLNHLLVFILRSLGVHEEEWPRTVTELRFSLQSLIWCQLRVVVGGTYFTYMRDWWTGQNDMTHACVTTPFL